MKKITKVIAFFVIAVMVMPIYSFGTVANLADDTRTPGFSLAGKHPAQKDIELQIPLADEKEFEVTIPTEMSKEDLIKAVEEGKVKLSLDRDDSRSYLDKDKFPNAFKGGDFSKWLDNRKGNKAKPFIKLKEIKVKGYDKEKADKAKASKKDGGNKKDGKDQKAEESDEDGPGNSINSKAADDNSKEPGKDASEKNTGKSQNTSDIASAKEKVSSEKTEVDKDKSEPKTEANSGNEATDNAENNNGVSAAADDEKANLNEESGNGNEEKSGEEKGVLQVKIETTTYFYDRKGNKDFSVPHSVGGAYMDMCGYFDLKALKDKEVLGSIHSKVVPFDSYRTIYELYDELEGIKAYSGNLYVKVDSFGHTTNGYDQQYVVVADQQSSVDNWLAYTDAVENNPEQAIADIKAGKYNDLRVPIMLGNCHTNEVAAVNGNLEFLQLLLKDGDEIPYTHIASYNDAGKKRLEEEKSNIFKTSLSKLIEKHTTEIGRLRGNDEIGEGYGVSSPVDLEKYYNLEKKTVSKQELLKHVFFVVAPTMNMEGYESVNRCSGAGHDPNRDEANQTMAETSNYMALLGRFNPLVYIETHGRVPGMLLEPCTPPHEPNFEYDLIAGQLMEVADAIGNGAVANNKKYNSYQTPARDQLELSSDSPTGVAWNADWDDMTPAYGCTFPILIGTMGMTWEMPAYNDEVSQKVIPYGVLSGSVYVRDNKAKMLANQAEVFKRGVKNENSNDKVGKFYVNQYDEPGAEAKKMRPVHDGKGENGNFYPESFIIPMDKAHQRNLEDAAMALKYLTRNDVKVSMATKEFTYKGVTYPKGTMIVSMYQAKRSLAHSQLFKGTFLDLWDGLYAESFSQQAYARGYDVITVAEPKEHQEIMNVAGNPMTHEEALSYLGGFASQFSGVQDADVIIENASIDSALAVNDLLGQGKKVGLITEGKDKTDYIVSYADYKSIADKYTLSAEGVYGKDIKAKLIKKVGTVYVPGAWTPSDRGYSGFSAWSYEYNFDKKAVERMGFPVTKDLSASDVIVGQLDLEKDGVAAVKAGKPYMAIGNVYFGDSDVEAPVLDIIGSGKAAICDKGIDFMGIVKYPENTLVNASYIKEKDDVNYQYGTAYFTKVPDGAKVLVQNAGKAPMQGCIGQTTDKLKSQFNEYNSSPVAFEFTKNGMDIVAFANTLTYKEHQTDEFAFISNFIFSRLLSDEKYVGVANPNGKDDGASKGESTDPKDHKDGGNGGDNGNPPKDDGDKNPGKDKGGRPAKTADESQLYLWFVIAGAGLGTVVLARRKRS